MRFIIFLLLISTVSFSQKVITGKVRDKEASLPLSAVLVRDTKTESWTMSDKDGNFELKIAYKGEVELIFSILGKLEQNQIVQSGQNSVTVFMEDNTLRLKEVVVTANKERKYSELTLGKNAINNVQAFSLEDVLQQLPGQTTTSFDLNKFKNIVFRSASPLDAAKAFGTAFVVNDIPVSNNENMQALNPNAPSSAASDYGVPNKTFNNPDQGVDLREISTNNIEEITVIQGIPSAKYGDLTSGLVLITTKVGNSPFRVSASLRDATSELNLTKGYNLSTNSSMNFGVNYLDSNSDPRNNLLEFKRIGGNISWQVKGNSSKIRNTLNASFRSTLDDAKYDPDDITASVVKNEKKGFSVSNNFMWKPDNIWVDGINLNGSFSYDKQFSRKDKWRNSSATAATNTLEEGIFDAYILPSQFTSVSTVEGIPVSGYVSLETSKVISGKTNWVHSFVFGLSGRTSSNKGAGRKSGVNGLINFYTFDKGGDTQLGYRDYDFNKTKTETQFSAYLEDRIYKKFEEHQILNVDMGLRYDNQSGYVSLQPRVNASFSLNKTYRFRGGAGLSSKSPSLNQIYTGDRYIDRLIGAGIYTYPGVYQKAWIQTIVTSGDNLNLRPSKSYRTELGVDIRLPFAMINFTGYYNKLFNGFSSQKVPVYRDLPKPVVTLNGTEPPTYEIVGTEKFYFFTNSITNDNISEDQGLETIINFRKIESLNLDVSMNASYVRSKDFSDVKRYTASSSLISEERYGVFNPRPNIAENLKTSFNFNYHIPAVGLLISVRSEHIVFRNNNELTKNYPIGYLDRELVFHEIPKSEQTDLQKYGHLIQSNAETDFEMKNMLHNFHLRVSKDFLNGFGVSLYATNFLNLKPFYYTISNEKTLSDIAQFSFGGKLTYEF